MSKKYTDIPLDKAYKLINTGMLVVISSKTNDSTYNVAPIAWNCPVEYDPVTRIMFVCDKEHQTYVNCLKYNEFGVMIPHISQVNLVKKIGSCSGKEFDKFEKYHIQSFKAKNIDVIFPTDAIGYLECKIYKIIDDESVAIIMGKVLHAVVHEAAFEKRLLTEKPEGKAIHHLGGKVFSTSGESLY